jgi:hypothetical protein
VALGAFLFDQVVHVSDFAQTELRSYDEYQGTLLFVVPARCKICAQLVWYSDAPGMQAFGSKVVLAAPARARVRTHAENEKDDAKQLSFKPNSNAVRLYEFTHALRVQ